MPTDDEILEMPDVVAMIEDAMDNALPVVGSQIVLAWQLGYAYAWHQLTPEQKETADGNR